MAKKRLSQGKEREILFLEKSFIISKQECAQWKERVAVSLPFIRPLISRICSQGGDEHLNLQGIFTRRAKKMLKARERVPIKAGERASLMKITKLQSFHLQMFSLLASNCARCLANLSGDNPPNDS